MLHPFKLNSATPVQYSILRTKSYLRSPPVITQNFLENIITHIYHREMEGTKLCCHKYDKNNSIFLFIEKNNLFFKGFSFILSLIRIYSGVCSFLTGFYTGNF